MPFCILPRENQSMKNREQLKERVLSLLASVWAQAADDVAGVDLGPTRAFSGEASTLLETFSRTLWAADDPDEWRGDFYNPNSRTAW
jgi:hypothetical protein